MDNKPPKSIQDTFLNELRKDKTPVMIYLSNGIKLEGQIGSFDQFIIYLKSATNQLIYKHTVSTVMPADHKSSHARGTNNRSQNRRSNKPTT